MACCAACVVLAVLTARGIAATSVPARGMAAHFTPRPEAVQQLAPPAPTAQPQPTAALAQGPGAQGPGLPGALGSAAGADAQGHRKYSPLLEEADDGPQQGEGPDGPTAPGFLRTIATQVRLFMACVPRWGPMSCLKLEALLLLHGESGDTVDGFVAGPDAESRRGSFFAELSDRPEARDAYLNKMLIQAVEELLEDAVGLSRDNAERGMRRRRRWGNPLIAVMFGLGSLIVVGGIAKTAMIAGKALALSLLALTLAVMMGLRGGGGGGGGGGAANYEILTGLRRRAGVAPAATYAQYPQYPVLVEAASEQQPSGLGALGPQSLAYSGHHTRP